MDIETPEQTAAYDYHTLIGVTRLDEASVRRAAFLAGAHWERQRGDLEALGALRAVLQGNPGQWVSPAYAKVLDDARDLLARRLKV